MFRLIKRLIFFSLGLAAVFYAYWTTLDSSAQKQLLVKIESRLSLWGIDLALVKEQAPLVKGQDELNDISSAMGMSKVGEYYIQVPCEQTLQTTEQSGGSVYRWVDENGNIHFSDNAYQSESAALEDISESVLGGSSAVFVEVKSAGTRVSDAVQKQVQAEAEFIYLTLNQYARVDVSEAAVFNLKLFSDYEAFEAYKNQFLPSSINVQGFYVPENNEVVVLETRRDTAKTLNTVRHYLTHLIVAKLFGPTPIWLSEGFAEYFEELDISGQNKSVGVKIGYSRTLRYEGKERALPSLEQFFSITPGTFFSSTPSYNYGLSWSLVFFLLSDNEQQTMLAEMGRYLVTYPCQKLNMENLLDAHYHGGFKRFESMWVEFLGNEQHQEHYY